MTDLYIHVDKSYQKGIDDILQYMLNLAIVEKNAGNGIDTIIAHIELIQEDRKDRCEK